MQEQSTRPGLFFVIAVDDNTTTLCSWRCVVVDIHCSVAMYSSVKEVEMHQFYFICHY